MNVIIVYFFILIFLSYLMILYFIDILCYIVTSILMYPNSALTIIHDISIIILLYHYIIIVYYLIILILISNFEDIISIISYGKSNSEEINFGSFLIIITFFNG